MIFVVVYFFIEEVLYDIVFFFRICGWMEFGLMVMIFIVIMFYFFIFGMVFGVGVLLLFVIKYSIRLWIQIFGCILGINCFENVEFVSFSFEFIEGCFIVKIFEFFIFVNIGEFCVCFCWFEFYGFLEVYFVFFCLCSQEVNCNFIFDIYGVILIDGFGI